VTVLIFLYILMFTSCGKSEIIVLGARVCACYDFRIARILEFALKQGCIKFRNLCTVCSIRVVSDWSARSRMYHQLALLIPRWSQGTRCHVCVCVRGFVIHSYATRISLCLQEKPRTNTELSSDCTNNLQRKLLLLMWRKDEHHST
jgi:hypothetical protein